MIIGKYDEVGIEIEASEESLRQLSEMMERGVGSRKLLLFSPQVPPTPYLGYLNSLSVDECNDDVFISRDDREMSISGSSEKLAIFAQHLQFLADEEPRPEQGNLPCHSHIEYYPGHFFLQQRSIPLIVTKRQLGDTQSALEGSSLSASIK